MAFVASRIVRSIVSVGLPVPLQVPVIPFPEKWQPVPSAAPIPAQVNESILEPWLQSVTACAIIMTSQRGRSGQHSSKQGTSRENACAWLVSEP